MLGTLFALKTSRIYKENLKIKKGGLNGGKSLSILEEL
jgi:hypothetical protein